ncbi:DNA internalization-related competence protein ComEC/Rec2 [Erwinia sp. CPCC 100877]|nr:DNA internalization-related competence protein ComEC/Rec2 [Erwinia sp. CPCC 100877]
MEWIYVLMALAACAAWGVAQIGRYLALMLCFCCWGVLTAHAVLWPTQAFTGRPLEAEVRVTRLEAGQIRQIQLLRSGPRWLISGPRVRIYGFTTNEKICPGQRWKMVLRLLPIHGQLNQGGFDAQRYGLSHAEVLRGRVVTASLISANCGLRGELMARVRALIQGLVWRETLMALAFGERVQVAAQTKKLLRDTGTAHLMAISGLHIGLAAGAGWLLARLAQPLAGVVRIGWRFPLFISLLFAVLYTWLAGAEPPALRSLWALIIWALLRLTGRDWHGWRVWLCCMAGILFVDPMALLSDSFRLSAGAVAGLLFWYQWVPFNGQRFAALIRYPLGLCHLQLGIGLLLLPLQAAIFHGFSLSAWFANLLAVPLVSFITVPLILAGLLTLALPPLSWGLMWMADRSLEALFYSLNALPAGWLELDARFVALTLFPWFGVVLWRLWGWRYFPGLTLGILAVLGMPLWRQGPSPGWQVHMLDIGHGLAMVVERNGRALLYDSGNAWPGGDAGQRTIAPWLRWHHLTPQWLILSHEHLDHAGGLASLRALWPTMRVRSSLGEKDHMPCWQGMRWRWQALDFSVHWPPRGWRGVGNNRSCVVKISDGRHSILLTGDIEKAAEQAMVRSQGDALRADVLQVPHHGSRTSSSPVLLRQVNPELAIASLARYSAWRLPSVVVVRRYRQRNIAWYDTARHGQITLRFGEEKPRLESLRAQILPRWYHQWFGVAPVNR